MKGEEMNFKKILNDKKGVFGLTAVQAFFATILGLALLAYVIVIIMGTLSGTTILDQLSGSVTNETGAWINSTSYTVDQSTLSGFTGLTITALYNATDDTVIGLGNVTIGTTGITNATATNWDDVLVSYTYTYNSNQQDDLEHILENTSTGISGFFSSISPVWAILAVLVIILVLVVLVRIVQNAERSGASPQL
jgi:hypothetical protein